jgi:histidinol-phosphate aminotransferase
MSQYWSKLIHGLTPYVPGEQPKINNLIKLNTNENPYGPSPKVLLALQKEASESLRVYPDIPYLKPDHLLDCEWVMLWAIRI